MVFIIDGCLNFRTSYWDGNGFREERPKMIAKHYIRRWFFIDFLSCLPLGYLEHMQDRSDSSTADVEKGNRAVKAFRLMKMTKMLRVARIRKVREAPCFEIEENSQYLAHWHGHWMLKHCGCWPPSLQVALRYSANAETQHVLHVMMLLFTIMLLAHLLACVFYLIGEGDEVVNGVYVSGWVSRQQVWWEASYRPVLLDSSITARRERSTDRLWVDDVSYRQLWLNASHSPIVSEDVSLIVRYSTSLIYVLNALAHSFTTAERNFSVLAELVRDVILGLVASVLTAFAMSVSSSTEESDRKLARLKLWMQKKKLPAGLQMSAMEHFNACWTSDTLGGRGTSFCTFEC
jgi:hypothetical protein